MRFDPRYVSEVLEKNFEDAKALFLEPLMAIHYAHLVMLAERGIVSPSDARRIREALDSISPGQVRSARYDATSEDLFSYLERQLVAACGEDVAGRLHTARSRNDIDMTMYRMRQRDWILDLVEATLELKDALVDLASRHRTTIVAAHTHTQPAQPTTIAHYLLAVIEQLERDVTRLRAALASTNRSPLGSCAITGTGFQIDRALTSGLLGFDGPTGNTYGSIATVDYLLESVSAVAVLMSGLGRFLQDLLLWCTMEVGYLRLPDGFAQSSTIMPQKRNPVALEHARAIASRALGQTAAITLVVHNTPFGDVVDTEDDLQPLVASTFQDALGVVTLVGAVVRGAELDEGRLAARAAWGGTTLTELADHLVRENGIPFRTAHAIAGRLMTVQRQTPDAPMGATLAAVSGELTGVSLEYTDAQIADIISPRHFVEVRRTHGGPAPDETARALEASAATLARDREWLSGVRGQVARAKSELRQRSQAL